MMDENTCRQGKSPRRWFRFDLGYLLLALTWLGIALGSLRISWTTENIVTGLFAIIAYFGALGAVLGGVFLGRMGWGAFSTLAMLLLFVCCPLLYEIPYIGYWVEYPIVVLGQPLVIFVLLPSLSAFVLMCRGLLKSRAARR